MCEYCENKDSVGESLGRWGCVEIVRCANTENGITKRWYEIRGSDFYGGWCESKPINFCPMCGRKLKEEPCE